MARASPKIALLVATGALYAAEFVGVTYYHAPEWLRLWPLAVVVAGVWCGMALLIFGGDYADRSGSVWAAPALLLPFAALIVVAVAWPDSAFCLVRSNCFLGRAIGVAISIGGKPSLDPTTLSSRPPDRWSARTFPGASVVLVSIDTLRCDALSPYAPAERTPAIDALAREAVVFDDAFAPRPTSAPSMASVLTGLYPQTHGVLENAMLLVDDVTTMAEFYRSENYATAGFVTNINFSDIFNFQQGFETFAYIDSKVDEHRLELDTADPIAVDRALAWVNSLAGEPFFLWVHLISPHSPYVPPALAQVGRGDRRWFNVLNMPAQEAELEGRRTFFNHADYEAAYRGEVQFVDAQVGRLMEGLKKAGRFDAAHVIFVADHGEAFGESDAFGHGTSLDPVETRVPLLWKLPAGAEARRRLGTTVQNVDILPSLLQLTGQAHVPKLEGRVISGIMLGDAEEDEGFAFTEAGYEGAPPAEALKYMVRTRSRGLSIYTRLPFVLEFARLPDVAEQHPTLHRADRDEMFNQLSALAATTHIQRGKSRTKVVLDDESKEKLRALGYIR
jgi:arylsulfatase A-like enzyme